MVYSQGWGCYILVNDILYESFLPTPHQTTSWCAAGVIRLFIYSTCPVWWHRCRGNPWCHRWCHGARGRHNLCVPSMFPYVGYWLQWSNGHRCNIPIISDLYMRHAGSTQVTSSQLHWAPTISYKWWQIFFVFSLDQYKETKILYPPFFNPCPLPSSS